MRALIAVLMAASMCAASADAQERERRHRRRSRAARTETVTPENARPVELKSEDEEEVAPEEVAPEESPPPHGTNPMPVRVPSAAEQERSRVSDRGDCNCEAGGPRPRDDRRTIRMSVFGFVGLVGRASQDLRRFDARLDDHGSTRTTAGAGLEVSWPMYRHFALGAMAALGSWNTKGLDDANWKRSTWYDLDLVPRLRYVTGDGWLETYVALPVGLTLNRMTKTPDGAAFGLGTGWNVQLLTGAVGWVQKDVGVFGQIGWMRHAFVNSPSDYQATDLSTTLSEMQLCLGLTYIT